MFRSCILISFLVSFFGNLQCLAQNDGGNPIAKRGFYRSHQVYGGFLHTSGLGVYYRKGWRATGFTNTLFNVELLNVRHPKEIKTRPIGGQNIRSFYYGKENSLSFIRTSFGYQKVLFDKEVEKGVRVSHEFFIGPTLALLKPVYLIVNYPSSEPARDVTERYDFEKHENVIIKGRAPFLQGVTEIQPRLGIHIKYGITFEFSKDDESIKALEFGSSFDTFLREIPIMANTYNNRFFLNLYLGYHFGKRSQ